MRLSRKKRERIYFHLLITPTKIINNKTDRPIPIRINLNLKPRCLCSTALVKCLFPCSS
jgi:hypothetical protein